MNQSLRILFISHDASRSGAPILILKLIAWLKIKKNIQPVILAINGGPLAGDFSKSGRCYLWNDLGYLPSLLERIYFKIIKSSSIKKHQRKVRAELTKEKFDIVYFNSVVGLSILDELNIHYPEGNTILHVHELHATIRGYGLESKIADSRIDKYIAVSDIVIDNLISNYNVDPEKVFKVFEYIDTNDWPESFTNEKLETPFVVAGSGYVNWRKGVDLFVLMANEIKKQGRAHDFEFWWIGAINQSDYIYLYEDLVKLGLEHNVKFLGEQKDLKEIYPKIDVLAITSREDPYPTVALEAAFHSIPFVCWNKGIGTAELVKKGCGFAVDYFDIGAMADSILILKEDPDLLSRLGRQARKEAEKHDINIAAEQIFEIINSS